MRKIVVLAVLCLAMSALAAQKASPNDFDYLLGDWEFTAVSQQWGEFRGYWSAIKLAEGQILDEYRVVGDKGETFYVTGTVRSYNKHKDRWDLVGMDRDSGLLDVGTGHRIGDEVFIEQTFGASGDKPRSAESCSCITMTSVAPLSVGANGSAVAASSCGKNARRAW